MALIALEPASTFVRVEVLPKGFTVVEAGITGKGRSAVGLTVACFLAKELAVGLNNVEVRFIDVVLAPSASEVGTELTGTVGGAGAGRALRMMSACDCFFRAECDVVEPDIDFG